MEKEKKYNKLVRDKIPEIIKNNNEIPITRILDDQEYKKYLEIKILEEQKEVVEATGQDRIEELADLLEIIISLTELEGKTLSDLIQVAKEKSDKRGGFKDKIFLEKVLANN